MSHGLRLGALCSALVLLALAAATPSYASCFAAPYSNCLPSGDINPATPRTYADLYQAYADFAWKDFLALNQPADQDGRGKYLPDPSPTRGLGYNGGNYTAVWNVYPEARDIFLPGAARPQPFATGHIIPDICLATTGGESPHKVLRKPASGAAVYEDTMVLDEYIQANRMGPVIDQNGQYARFGINFNRSIFQYIVDNTLYSAQGQAYFDRNNPDRDKQTVRFPKGVYPSQTGSLFVKSTWKILGPDDDPARYFRTTAYIYEEAGGAFHDEPTVKEHCQVATVGLVGFHIVHLTTTAPVWVWATFEHVQNAPWLANFASGTPSGPFDFFNPSTCQSVSGKPSCAYNTLPPQPWNPQFVTPPASRTQLVRVAAPGSQALAYNQNYQAQLNAAYGPNNVWKNYFLADVQFPTVVQMSGQIVTGPNPAYPDGVPSPSLLANSTLETYIEGFSAGQMTSNGNVIPADDQMVTVGTGSVNPFNPKASSNQSGGAQRVTSSCVGCHADAAMTTGSNSDFVFSLNRAQSAPAKKAPPAAKTRAATSPHSS